MPKPKPTSLPQSESRHLSLVVPEEIRDLFGPPPLTFLENAEAYEELFSRIAIGIHPKDIIEWLWVRDICDLVWDTRRLRKARAEVIRLSLIDALGVILSEHKPNILARGSGLLPKEGRELACKWLAGEADAKQNIQALLKQRGYDLASVEAQAYLLNLEQLERFDKMITASDYRRDAILRDVERRRTIISARLREISETLINESPT